MIAKHIHMRLPSKSSLPHLVEYLAEGQGVTERVGEIRITNCASVSLGAAVDEMLATQQLNTRALSDRTYHLLLSFQAGEDLSPQVLQAIEQRVCEALGFGEHQRVSVIHHDTDNLHVHVAINKIHPRRLTMHEPFQPYRTLGKACARCEVEFGLRVDNHIPQRTTSQGRAGDMEQHTGIESLMTWVRSECLANLQQARSWAELHEVLRDHGLELRERGAGLVIEAGDGTRVKASTVDRGLSKQALEARLGAFQAERAPRPAHGARTAKGYTRRPVRTRVDTSELFARYKQEQEGLRDARTAALAAAKRRKEQALEEAKRAYRLHRAAVRVVDGRSIDKRLLYAQASHAMERRLRAIRQEYDRERSRILHDHEHHTWADWLKAEAIKGDQQALAALRARTKGVNLHGSILSGYGTAAPADAAVAIDTVTKAGTIVYRAGNNAVRDDGQRLQVSREADLEAIKAALKLAHQQYGDRIDVNGSAAFKAQVVRTAVDLGLSITFTDPGLERQRQALMRKERVRDQAQQPQGSQRVAGRSDGLDGIRRRAAVSAARHAGSAVRAQPHAGRTAPEPPPASRHGVRNLSELGVVRQRQGSAQLLPGDVRGGVEHQGAQRTDGLRWPVHQPGGQGQGRGRVGAAPPPARGRGRLRTVADLGEAGQPARKGIGKVPIPPVGTKPPPKAGNRLRPMSSLEPRGPSIVPREPVPAPAPVTPAWRISGAILSPAACAAADKYIAERESKRARGLDVPKYARYSADAGPLTYAGTRNVDGQTLALLQCGDELLVMPIDPVTAIRLRKAALGQVAKVTANGSITTGRGRGRGQSL